MTITTSYPSHILQQYRQRVENDLRLLEQEKLKVERSAGSGMGFDASHREIAAMQQVLEVLRTFRNLLINAQAAR
ncbi:hypothetical protein ABZV67_33385 [Streptomyces sp. NPDC005065]|uniref:hypothetical protein n=1 Tax=Streptomyces sp. NPDC005065 TaxID=3154461 RepID=UPI0033A91054